MGCRSDVAIAILAGGQGARFWPMSRMSRPKQFLSLGEGGESLIQATVHRLEKLVPRSQMMVITSRELVSLVEEHVPGVQVLVEPFGRNTAAALALGARVLEGRGFQGVMIGLPADHAVKNEENLVVTLERAVEVAGSSDNLVTIGISPERPDTAFGYIQRGDDFRSKVFHVKRFFEKPSLQRAERYLESGDFYWNSGMFAWKPSVYMSALEKFLPGMYSAFESLAIDQTTMPNEESITEVYNSIESISVDFGVMEHATNVLMVQAEPYGWSDVGSWDAWAEHFQTDELGNLLKGDCVALGGRGNIVSSSDRFIALVGAEDMVVVDTDDALLVCPRSKVQEVKKVVEYLKGKGRGDLV